MINSPEAEVSNNVFNNNKAHKNCSSIYVKDFSKLMIDNNNFTHN